MTQLLKEQGAGLRKNMVATIANAKELLTCKNHEERVGLLLTTTEYMIALMAQRFKFALHEGTKEQKAEEFLSQMFRDMPEADALIAPAKTCTTFEQLMEFLNKKQKGDLVTMYCGLDRALPAYSVEVIRKKDIAELIAEKILER